MAVKVSVNVCEGVDVGQSVLLVPAMYGHVTSACLILHCHPQAAHMVQIPVAAMAQPAWHRARLRPQ